MSLPASYLQASTKTANDLRSIAHSQEIRALTRLSLPEIDAVVDLTAQIIPAGNVPGMILSGLARIPGQRLPAQTKRAPSQQKIATDSLSSGAISMNFRRG